MSLLMMVQNTQPVPDGTGSCRPPTSNRETLVLTLPVIFLCASVY